MARGTFQKAGFQSDKEILSRYGGSVPEESEDIILDTQQSNGKLDSISLEDNLVQSTDERMQ